jgi:hypothetical protein
MEEDDDDDFEGTLNFSLCFKFLVSQTPLPYKISCGTSRDLLGSCSMEIFL